MHWDTEGPQQEAQELWQAGRGEDRRTDPPDLWPLTLGGSNRGPTSASAVGVQEMLSRAVGNTLPMMQGGPRHAASAPGVVRETGGAGGIAGCEAQRVSINDTRSKRLNAPGSIQKVGE